MKKLFASVNYSFSNFYNNLTISGQMIFSIIVFLIIVLCILLFVTYVYQSMKNKKDIKKLKDDNIKIVSEHKYVAKEDNKNNINNKKEIENIANKVNEAIKEENTVSLTDFEEDQEKTAIISIQELYEKAKELEIIDDDDGDVNYLEKYNIQASEIENCDTDNSNKNNKGEVKAFRVSQVISPIYGIKKEVINDNKK